jgi:hypothetical protein
MATILIYRILMMRTFDIITPANHFNENIAQFYSVSENSGTSGNFNCFSYFYLQLKVKG